MSNKRRQLSRRLHTLVQEFDERKRNRGNSMARMRVWKFTVELSYFIKRLLDIVLSIIGLILFSPIFVIAAIIIKCTSPGPILFVQVRVGYYGRHFRFYKLRTMEVDADEKKEKLAKLNQSSDGVIFKMKNDPRIIPFGAWLRKTSIDELPQLFNVLIGDMSMVGPRPPLPSEVKQYSIEERKRLNVKPGLTCIWQVSGRSDLPFKRQVQLDKQYIQSQSLGLDLLILLRTIPAIISGKGAY